MLQRLFSKTIIYNVSLNTCFIAFFHGNTHYRRKIFELMKLSLAQAEVRQKMKGAYFFVKSMNLCMTMTCIKNQRLEKTRSTHRARNKYIQRYWPNTYSERKWKFFRKSD